MAILAPNLDLALLEPSCNYNLAVKWPFWLQIGTWAFWSLLAINLAVKWPFWFQIWTRSFCNLLAITLWL